MHCQLTTLRGLRRPSGPLAEALQVRVRILRKSKRALKYAIKRALRALGYSSGPTDAVRWAPVEPGDLVEVRPFAEIRSTLDDREKTRGCMFIDEMQEHCGRRYKIFKRVESFFDETRQRMCTTKNVVLLEGVTCSGRQRLYVESCDRNCFFFWHTSWLRKVGGER